MEKQHSCACRHNKSKNTEAFKCKAPHLKFQSHVFLPTPFLLVKGKCNKKFTADVLKIKLN